MAERDIILGDAQVDAFSEAAMQQRATMIWRSGAQRDVRASVDRDAWRKAMRAIKKARSSKTAQADRDGADVLVLTDRDRAAANPSIDDILVLNRLAR